MISTINNINDGLNVMNVSSRVGIHTGPIVAGVIGKNKFAYDFGEQLLIKQVEWNLLAIKIKFKFRRNI